MEVHAHPHTPRKKWTHYFWEFLMLFLAVFAGFLAENQREHYIEHQREKQYMLTMVEDLESDTVQLSYALHYWEGINNSIDSVAEALTLPLAAADFPKAYRHLNNALNYYSFAYNDRTIAQLKNAGGFRLIRKKKVANKIITYDQFNNDAIKNIASQYNKFYENVVLLRNKVFSQYIISKIFDQYEFKAPPISTNSWIDSLILKNRSPFNSETQTQLVFEFKNALLAFRKDFTNMEWGYVHLLKLQADLLKLLKEEYHLSEKISLEK
ncbi:MAG TPA: hypothetical protein VMZ03_05465 [Chitinophagaceae bacterium]|nr:hypothetical protein [Chitinophagaceae bacterium]